jgi:hypothetical protein
MNYDFAKDMAVADKIEVAVVQKLQKHYNNFKFCGFSGTKGYDCVFMMGDKTYTLEIKADFFTSYTGNVVIEFESRGKDSGITTSKASFFAYAVMQTEEDFDLYIITTKKLKQMVENKEYFDIVVGGDVGSRTKMYRFKLDHFAKYAKKIG